MDFETRAIHEGQEPDPATGAVIVPIYQTSTYVQEAVGEHKGYDYSRVANPTRTALQICLASLEGAEHGIAFASGIAATTTAMHLVNPGDRVVCVERRLRRRLPDVLPGLRAEGLRVRVLAADEINTNFAEHLDERTRLVWLETPTNPLLNMVDIRAAAEAAHEVGAVRVVDNTFASPYLQQPLALGADIVMHSATKYLAGHSDMIGGFLATNDPTIAERSISCRSRSAPSPARSTAGSCCAGSRRSPSACASTVRTRAASLPSSSRTSTSSASSTPACRRIPATRSRARQMRDFGGMISFLAASEEEAVELVARTSLWKLAESLGGVESLIEHPRA